MNTNEHKGRYGATVCRTDFHKPMKAVVFFALCALIIACDRGRLETNSNATKGAPEEGRGSVGLVVEMEALSTVEQAAPVIDYRQILDTKDFVITISWSCPEGNVTWDDVSYVGVNKKSGASIQLKGETWHAYSPDGTPSHFQGFQFKNGDVTYQVRDEGREGRLMVFRGETEVLVNESGTWRE
jgi:hypothetical protein